MKKKPKEEEKVVMTEAGETFVTEQKGFCGHGAESQTLSWQRTEDLLQGAKHGRGVSSLRATPGL